MWGRMMALASADICGVKGVSAWAFICNLFSFCLFFFHPNSSFFQKVIISCCFLAASRPFVHVWLYCAAAAISSPTQQATQVRKESCSQIYRDLLRALHVFTTPSSVFVCSHVQYCRVSLLRYHQHAHLHLFAFRHSCAYMTHAAAFRSTPWFLPLQAPSPSTLCDRTPAVQRSFNERNHQREEKRGAKGGEEFHGSIIFFTSEVPPVLC